MRIVIFLSLIFTFFVNLSLFALDITLYQNFQMKYSKGALKKFSNNKRDNFVIKQIESDFDLNKIDTLGCVLVLEEGKEGHLKLTVYDGDKKSIRFIFLRKLDFNGINKLIDEAITLFKLEQRGSLTIFQAIRSHLWDEVEAFLKKDSVETMNFQKQTAFSYILSIDLVDKIELFLQYNPNIYTQDQNGITPLHHIARLGLFELFKKQYNPLMKNLSTNSGRTFMDFALFSGNSELIEFLKGENLEHSKNQPIKTYVIEDLNDAIYYRDYSEIKRKIDLGDSLFKQNSYGRVPILTAFQSLPMNQIKPLLKGDENWSEIRDEMGLTALHYSVLGGNFEGVLYLIDKITANIFGKEGESPLYFAMITEQPELFYYLYSKGGDIHTLSPQGETMLHHSIKVKNRWFFNFIMNNHPYLAKRENVFKESLLHIAVKNGNLDIISLILEIDSVNSVDIKGNTPINLAILSKNDEIFNLLIEERPYLDFQNIDGECPLDIALKIGNENAILKLQKENAPICLQKK